MILLLNYLLGNLGNLEEKWLPWMLIKLQEMLHFEEGLKNVENMLQYFLSRALSQNNWYVLTTCTYILMDTLVDLAKHEERARIVRKKKKH